MDARGFCEVGSGKGVVQGQGIATAVPRCWQGGEVEGLPSASAAGHQQRLFLRHRREVWGLVMFGVFADRARILGGMHETEKTYEHPSAHDLNN